MSVTWGGCEWVDVRLVGLPVQLWAAFREHHEELRREFALVAVGRQEGLGHLGEALPLRLVELVERLTGHLTDLAAEQRSRLADAAYFGETSLDLTYRLPVTGAAAVEELLALMVETDVHCREGHHLLTLAMPPALVVFRDWYLGEIIGQLRGAQPTPWSPRQRRG